MTTKQLNDRVVELEVAACDVVEHGLSAAELGERVEKLRTVLFRYRTLK